MKIYLAADHNGQTFRQQLALLLMRSGFTVIEIEDKTPNPNDDFPQFAARVVHALKADADTGSRGILICASGQGMCMAANRYKGIRASLCWNVEEARAARNDDDSNVLCLPSRYITLSTAETVVLAWLHTAFAAAPRFVRRIRELDEIS